jgi:hypothetical protein
MRKSIRFTSFLLFVSVLPSWGNVILIDPKPVVFMGKQSTGIYRLAVGYTWMGKPWKTTMNTLGFISAGSLEAQGFENPFMQALSSNLGNGWSYNFNTTAVIADNTFQVHTYEAEGPPPPATNNDAFTLAGLCPSNNCAGSQFFFNYVATGQDPDTNVHWVQVLYDNYVNQAPVQNPFYEIDNAGNNAPYYDGPYLADATGFRDTPYCCTNTGAGTPIVFDALTLLVTGPAADAPGQFTIYGGIEWGWSNVPTPEPTSMLLFATALPGVAFVLRRRRLRR